MFDPGAEPRELSLAIQASAALDREAFGVGGPRDRPPFVGIEATLEIRLLTRPAAPGTVETAEPTP